MEKGGSHQQARQKKDMEGEEAAQCIRPDFLSPAQKVRQERPQERTG